MQLARRIVIISCTTKLHEIGVGQQIVLNACKLSNRAVAVPHPDFMSTEADVTLSVGLGYIADFSVER